MGESNKIDILQSEQLADLSREDQLECATRCLCEAAREITTSAYELREIAANFDSILQFMVKVLCAEDRRKWEDTIIKAMEGRKE